MRANIGSSVVLSSGLSGPSGLEAAVVRVRVPEVTMLLAVFASPVNGTALAPMGKVPGA